MKKVFDLKSIFEPSFFVFFLLVGRGSMPQVITTIITRRVYPHPRFLDFCFSLFFVVFNIYFNLKGRSQKVTGF